MPAATPRYHSRATQAGTQLGQYEVVPIDPKVVVGSDTGDPIVVSHPQSAPAQAFREIAAKIMKQIESGHVGHTHDAAEHAHIH